MSFGNNSKEVNLAREYKYLLSNIRPLIEQLDKSKDAQLCLLWLSKLDQCSRYEEYERNEILSELSRQVKNKCLEPPFNSQPPPGPLRNIAVKLTTETSPRSPLSTESNRSCAKDEFLSPWRGGKFSHKSSSCFKTMRELTEEHGRCLALQQKYHERIVNDQLLIGRYQEIIKSLISQNLKGSGSVKLKSLRMSYENKIYDLTSSLKSVEEENRRLRQKMAGDASVEKMKEMQAVNEELTEKLGQLEITNNILESKCRELEMDKNAITSELTCKLTETEKRLRETENHLRAVEKKHNENFWASKSEHQAEIGELEKKYTCELSALERILEEKQSEISSLRDQVTTQCLHFEAEVLRLKNDLLENPDLEKERRKVKFLKGKVKKLERGHETMAMAFQSQLAQIVAKKDLLISTLEMRVKSEDADSVGNGLRSELDNLISEKVDVLEAQYRKLLEESESQAAQRRQSDLQKILTLEKQLVDHGVGVQDLCLMACPENLMLTGPKEIPESVTCEEDHK